MTTVVFPAPAHERDPSTHLVVAHEANAAVPVASEINGYNGSAESLSNARVDAAHENTLMP